MSIHVLLYNTEITQRVAIAAIEILEHLVTRKCNTGDGNANVSL